MKEIGGYFGLEKLISKEYYPTALSFNSARNALLFVLQQRKIEKIYIPYFLCDSVSGLCEKYGYDFEYYRIDQDFKPIFNKQLKEKEYIYVVNFYGQITNKQLKEIKAIHKNVIFDNVQAFFQKSLESVDTIYSCRKFFGVPDGSYLATTLRLDGSNLVADKSKDRMMHVLGRFEGCASDYYQDFKDGEKVLEDTELKLMSALTHNLLGAINYKAVRKSRERNFAYLNEKLSSLNKLKIRKIIGPYAYPFYCENGMEVKKKLAERKIYVPTLWPNVVENFDGLEKDYAENILPLPCDQRYDESDMKTIVEEILKCIN